MERFSELLDAVGGTAVRLERAQAGTSEWQSAKLAHAKARQRAYDHVTSLVEAARKEGGENA